MNAMRTTFFYSFMLLSLHTIGYKKALVIAPVVDLVGSPVKKENLQEIAYFYAHLPACGGKNCMKTCPRLHQLLFHEVVDVIAERGNQIQIAIPNLFFITHESDHRHTQYWALKKDFRLLSAIPPQEQDKIPDPIRFNRMQAHGNKNTVTLIAPFTDAKTGITFSAGTRFIKKDEIDAIAHVYAFNRKTNACSIVSVPKVNLIENNEYEAQKKISQFVQVLHSWCTYQGGIIPYVWGGSSFACPCTATKFHEITDKKSLSSFFAWDHYAGSPHSGFDCTGLVARAAQICGLPYFYKNSLTVAKMLKSLKPDQSLHEGDLIWVPGHLMVIANIEKNTIIEARHYAHGYGKVQEIELASVFKDINTFDQLRAAFEGKQPIYRMNNKGEIKDTFKEFKLLPIAQIWEKQT